MRFAAVGIVILGLAWTARPEQPGLQQGAFHWRGRLSRGQELAIRGANGTIHAVPASGEEAEVSAVKRGRRSDPEDVQIEVVPDSAGVTICAVYPSSRWREPNECLPGGRGRNNTNHNDVKVDFTVRVPSGIRFVGKTVQGDVTADSLSADVEAHSVNGDVDVTTRGQAEATTVNGSVRAVLGRADWTGELEFHSVNGGITVVLPAEVSAAVNASTVNGSIDSDFPLTVHGRFSAKRLTGTIGRGGRELHLKTVNGSITLRRGS
jgi:hypothetical protein